MQVSEGSHTWASDAMSRSWATGNQRPDATFRITFAVVVIASHSTDRTGNSTAPLESRLPSEPDPTENRPRQNPRRNSSPGIWIARRPHAAMRGHDTACDARLNPE